MELTLQKIERFTSTGTLAFDNGDRAPPQTEPMDFGASGWIDLPAGSYLVTFNEIVNIPEMWPPWPAPAPRYCAAGRAWRLPFGTQATGAGARACWWSTIQMGCG